MVAGNDHQTATGIIPVELRADGAVGVVSGVAVLYGDTAKIGARHTEAFAAGALVPYARGVLATVQHNRGRLLARYPDAGLRLMDSKRALRAEIDLPDTNEGRDTAEMVRSQRLSGLSIEFVPLKTSEIDRGNTSRTVVERATLLAVSLVDIPAYPKSEIDRLKRWADFADDTAKRRRTLWL